MNKPDPHQDAIVLHQGPPVEGSSAVLVCLHGRGTTAEDALSLGSVVAPPNTALLAPQADGRSWYPKSFLAPIEQNQPYLDSALRRLSEIAGDLRRAGVPRSRTMLVCFSQGACLACEFIARHPEAASRAAVLTGGLIGDTLDESRYLTSDARVEVYITTGVPDAHVPEERVTASVRVLERLGHDVSVATYAWRPHTVSTDEIVATRHLLRMD